VARVAGRESDDRGPSKRKLLIFYPTLAVVAAVVASIAVSAGQDVKPQKSIAGGYDATGAATACLGQRVDVKQSGKFVSFTNTLGKLGGALEFDDGHLTGDVKCVGGEKQKIDARAANGTITGTVGGQPAMLTLKRDPPAAGTPKAYIPGSIAGEYKLSPRSECLGGLLELHGDSNVKVDAQGTELGELHYNEGTFDGTLRCKRSAGSVGVTGTAQDRQLSITLTPPAAPGAPKPIAQTVTATKQREVEKTFAAFFIAVAVVMLAARLLGMLFARFGQPRVMGEVTAGILLGPTLLGKVAPGVEATIFPTDITPFIAVTANLGLIFYMFLVGLEIDPAQLKGRLTRAAVISNGSVTFAMLLGISVAVPIYGLVGPEKPFLGFALFMGVTMSITAFPILARILVERRMIKRPLGAVALACAAMDDVTAWFLIALATAVAAGGGGGGVLLKIALVVVFAIFMFTVIRRLLLRASAAFDEAGRVPGGWIVAIFAGILISAFTTEVIGIAIIFGAFIMGAVMPRHAGLTEDVTHRVEDFVVTLLLPLFFAATGLRTNFFLLDRPALWLLTIALIAVAMTGKLFGATMMARFSGLPWRDSQVIGTLMNTRGLTELIVLNLALEKGVISEALFASLVIMALFTTFLTGPLLKLLDPQNKFGAPVEEELVEAREQSRASFPDLPVPERSILVAPQDDATVPQLVSLAEPLARSEPPRELIITRLVRPPRGADIRGGLQTEDKLLRDARDHVAFAQLQLVEKGVAARAVTFSSVHPGADLVTLAQSEEVDLLLIDGRRPLLGEGVPRGDVGTVLLAAECDVAVLVAREGERVVPTPERGVLVPFGGAEHDWAALELGAWIAAATGAPLRMLGAAGQTDDQKRATRLLGDASMLVQQYAGIAAEPVMAEPGREGIIEAAEGSGLLVLGLSDRWKEEGLGPTRSEIAKTAPAPTLFVRRGLRPGALAPRGDVTRFTWSSPGAGGFTPGQPIS
jgi:Kef-type K+ transport system membrane component KefB